MSEIEQRFPHCDQRVLHRPTTCHYCDTYASKWQELREAWGIAFTGEQPTEGQLPCPSDAQRGLGGAHVWGGNAPAPDIQQAILSPNRWEYLQGVHEQRPDGSWQPATPLDWMEEHNRVQRFVLWLLRRPHCSDEAHRRDVERAQRREARRG